MKKPICRSISLLSVRLRRVRVAPLAVPQAAGSHACRVIQLQPGAALVPVLPAQQILGCWWRGDGGLTVYVSGTMPLALRTAVEEGATHQEQWLTAVRGGIQEIDLTECREAYHFVPGDAPEALAA